MKVEGSCFESAFATAVSVSAYFSLITVDKPVEANFMVTVVDFTGAKSED